MGVRTTSQEGKVALYDSVTDMAFGPIFDTDLEADLFLIWYDGKYGDPRNDWWLSAEGQQTFLSRYREWAAATTDVNTGEFRVDIGIQMSREES